MIYLPLLMSRDGGIGRRARFRGVWGQPRGGSSPLLGTNKEVFFAMVISPIQTDRVNAGSCTVIEFIDRYVKDLPERSILVVTAKVVSLCEGQVVSKSTTTKQQLAYQEADYYLPAEQNKYGVVLTIKNNILVGSAGVDTGNSAGYFTLWPKNPQQTVNQIWDHLRHKFHRREIGVIICDSRSTPLRQGATGIGIAHCGFLGVIDQPAQPDIFGESTWVLINVVDALASAACLVMGESNEQVPLTHITEAPRIQFQEEPPSPEELKKLYIPMEEDFFSKILLAVPWKKNS